MSNFYKVTVLLLLTFVSKAQIPSATIVANSAGCTGVGVTFSVNATNSPTSYSWSISPSFSVSIFPDNTNSTIAFTFANAGVYTASCQVANGTGTTTAVKTITVSKTATAAFNASLTNTGYPAQLVLTNYSTNLIKNYWVFSHIPGIAGKDSTTNTVMTYSASGAYTVQLIAIGNNGCNDTASYSFYINDSSGISAPNVFTPNNDGVNDVFKPIVRGVSSLKGYVYDRFGTIIYSWNKINGFWDGYTTSGQPCQDGVYFYVIEAVGFDGKSYKIKNNLTLIH